MKRHLTAEWLGGLQQQVEEHLDKATRVYQNLPEVQLLQPDPGGGWSAAQCLEHLNSYGRYYLPAVQGAIDTCPTRYRHSTPYFRSGYLGSYFTSLMKAENKRKYKAMKGHVPPSDLNGAQVVASFIDQQEHWLQLLREAEHLNLNQIKVPISISKFVRLNLGDTFAFVKAHDERHIQQADRVLEGIEIA
ncbi:DinB family protein [Telluribacter sp. SYSU D00476]|uniref:DinB family protein n=1 Tax=Telluribacter sp. SYSU D00476 TaxID=2811430 RepID=UPI001FF3E4D9|nr:DinB family protein [Telluribacter sp. SYSU D00476]